MIPSVKFTARLGGPDDRDVRRLQLDVKVERKEKRVHDGASRDEEIREEELAREQSLTLGAMSPLIGPSPKERREEMRS
ncbi:hypothetical protein OUZ56_013329 [Daphnia magna]|uniref:Uncharacterized protein n=1 Tax=Daphnia magna TaxID=35525 RepID=A0ABQ9Z5K2_9CRUS|nr:hypothetical protein OUZ56_013329 [Daphnia magna]